MAGGHEAIPWYTTHREQLRRYRRNDGWYSCQPNLNELAGLAKVSRTEGRLKKSK